MAVYDCFIFYNELELLDLRLHVLESVVDRFVLVEATRTITGHPKELVFANHTREFSPYLDKITHVVVDDLPVPDSPSNAMPVEYFQRNAIMRGLCCASPDTRIMVSDVDEIPNPEAVRKYASHDRVVGFPMSLYYYYVNCLQVQRWWGTVMATLATMPPPQSLREHRLSTAVKAVELGWHFSFLGGVEKIRDKLRAFSETSVNKPEFSDPEHLAKCLQTGADMFNRKDAWAQKRFVPIDDTYPSYIHEWLQRYPYMVKT